MKSLIPKYLIAYIMWAAFIALGLFAIILSRTSLGELLFRYYVRENLQHANEAQLIDRVYLTVMGIILLILFIIIEEYFKVGARKNTLARRIAKVFGFELIFLFFVNLVSAYLTGFSIPIIAILVLEIVISVLLLWFGYRIRRAIDTNKI